MRGYNDYYDEGSYTLEYSNRNVHIGTKSCYEDDPRFNDETEEHFWTRLVARQGCRCLKRRCPSTKSRIQARRPWYTIVFLSRRCRRVCNRRSTKSSADWRVWRKNRPCTISNKMQVDPPTVVPVRHRRV